MVKRHGLCKFTIEQEQQICQQYVTRNPENIWEGTPTIARRWGTSASIINHILKAYNIPKRTISQAITEPLYRISN